MIFASVFGPPAQIRQLRKNNALMLETISALKEIHDEADHAIKTEAKFPEEIHIANLRIIRRKAKKLIRKFEEKP